MIHVKVCIGTNCSYHGGQQVLEQLESEPFFLGKIELEVTKCFDDICDGGKNSPLVEVEGRIFENATTREVSEAIFHALEERGEV